MKITFTLTDATHKRKDLTITTWTDVVKHTERPELGVFVIIERIVFNYIRRRLADGYVISNIETEVEDDDKDTTKSNKRPK